MTFEDAEMQASSIPALHRSMPQLCAQQHQHTQLLALISVQLIVCRFRSGEHHQRTRCRVTEDAADEAQEGKNGLEW